MTDERALAILDAVAIGTAHVDREALDRARGALRVKGMLVKALMEIDVLTRHGPATKRAEAFARLNQISGRVHSTRAKATVP